jgi:hypothetical protein
VSSQRAARSVKPERSRERRQRQLACLDFGARFVELACSVPRHNDRRSALKQAVNDLLGSPLRELKDYGGAREK